MFSLFLNLIFDELATGIKQDYITLYVESCLIPAASLSKVLSLKRKTFYYFLIIIIQYILHNL